MQMATNAPTVLKGWLRTIFYENSEDVLQETWPRNETKML